MRNNRHLSLLYHHFRLFTSTEYEMEKLIKAYRFNLFRSDFEEIRFEPLSGSVARFANKKITRKYVKSHVFYLVSK